MQKSLHVDLHFAKAEEYLVQVIGTQLKTMNAMRYFVYHISKNVAYSDLPPTSQSIAAHIQRSLYSTYIQIHCMKKIIDPYQYGFEYCNELLVPIKDMKLLPDDLSQVCVCVKCATKRCPCRENKVACCT